MRHGNATGWRCLRSDFGGPLLFYSVIHSYTLSLTIEILPGTRHEPKAHQNNGAVQHAKDGAASAAVPRLLIVRTSKVGVRRRQRWARMKSLPRGCAGGHGAGGGTRGPWPQRGGVSSRSSAIVMAAVAILLGTAPLVRYRTLCSTILELPILKAAHSESITDIFSSPGSPWP